MGDTSLYVDFIPFFIADFEGCDKGGKSWL
jgi:hypothetical protein